MKKLLGLLLISGAVTATLFFLTSLARTGGNQATQPITLQPGSVIQEGSLVAIEYTLTDDTGKVIDSNVGKEPLTYLHGRGQIVPGLEKELTGLKVGDQKKSWSDLKTVIALTPTLSRKFLKTNSHVTRKR